jgi:hypothetical protein
VNSQAVGGGFAALTLVMAFPLVELEFLGKFLEMVPTDECLSGKEVSKVTEVERQKGPVITL